MGKRFQRQKFVIYVQTPLCMPRTRLTRSEANVTFLLVEEMYLQVGINSLLTADLASFICYCKVMLENET